MKYSTAEKSFSRKILRLMAILISLAIFLGIGGIIYYHQSIGPVNVQNGELVVIEIPKGASTLKIASILRENHLIKNDLSFRILSKLSKAEGKMQAGRYQMSTSMNAREIIDNLIKGSIFKDAAKFTIPEGFELKQIVDRLESLGLIDREKFMELVNNGDFQYEFLKEIPKGENRLEGFLFPDTYEIAKGATEEEILTKMLDRFDEIFTDDYYHRTKKLNMTIQEVVTLASIIEREAQLEKERPIISGIFHNRLNKGMLLQSCATVQYVLGERKANLSLKDIDIDSPYNTYKNIGLPPAPIASPGKASLEAALYPSETDYYYFVVKSDGEHSFSKTYEEHLRAKNGN
ncbi:endolytic transglycosylase MltG [Anaerosolibacter carboniphilus]|nr:endolytic transglycosylase MltG [Anaerosolibacter carboniphilus]